MGQPQKPANTDTIQARIDALLITHQYAHKTEKPAIQQRITALQTALEYA